MAVATYTPTTSSSDISELWRKVQYGVVVAAQFGYEEWNMVQKLKKFNVDWSAREITMELDINDGYGASSIIEGGYEARPSSPTAVTATLTWILLNKRFTVSLTAQYIAQRTPRAMLESQLKFQSKKAVQALRRKVADLFYGFSNGVAAEISSTTLTVHTLKDMYGVTGLGAATDDHPVTDLFRVGDVIALLDPAAFTLTASSIQAITAVTPATPSITTASIAAAAANDLVVFANNLENATVAAGTEYNLGLVGLLDQLTSTSVHSVSSSSYSNWAAGYSYTSGGRFTGVRLRKMKQGIYNTGGGKLDTVLWTNGVENDVMAQLQAGLRFSDSWGMEMDGQPKSKGIKFMTTRRVPDGYVFGWDSKNSICKATLLPEPGNQAFADGDKLQDQSGLVFSLDYPIFLVTKNRANMAYVSGVAEQ
jgi:hypothetical protein